jgi:hypothetical protein
VVDGASAGTSAAAGRDVSISRKHAASRANVAQTAPLTILERSVLPMIDSVPLAALKRVRQGTVVPKPAFVYHGGPLEASMFRARMWVLTCGFAGVGLALETRWSTSIAMLVEPVGLRSPPAAPEKLLRGVFQHLGPSAAWVPQPDIEAVRCVGDGHR